MTAQTVYSTEIQAKAKVMRVGGSYVENQPVN